MSPWGGRSTFTTSAPCWARIMVPKGPERLLVRSSTRTPASGPVDGRLDTFVWCHTIGYGVQPMRDVVIVEAVRTPTGRRNGGLSTMHSIDLLGLVQREVLRRKSVDPA